MQRFQFTPRHPIVRVAFTADGTELITAQPHTSIAIRDRLTGQPRTTIPTANVAAFYDLLPHPTANLLAVRCSKWMALFRLGRAGNAISSISNITGGFGHIPGGVRFITFSRGTSSYLSYAECIPPVEELDLVQVPWYAKWTENRLRITAQPIAVSPDGWMVLAVRQRTRPLLLDVLTGRVIAELNAAVRTRNYTSNHLVVAFSPDSSKIALGNGDSLAVFDLSRVNSDEPPRDDESTKKLKVLYPLFTLDRPDPVAGRGTHADRTAERWLPPLAFDPSGRTLLMIGLRNRVQRIDVATGGLLVEWAWRAEMVRCLTVAPDGLTAAAGCRQGELMVWDLE